MICSFLVGTALLFVPLQTTVTFAVVGVPGGQHPPVTIQTPSGQTVSAEHAEALREIRMTESGTYRMSSTAFRVPSGLVDTIYDPQPTVSRTVQEGETVQVELRFSPRGGTGMLWIASVRTSDEDDFTQGQLRAFRGTDLASGSLSAPTRVITTGPRNSGGVITPNGVFLYSDNWDIRTIMRVDPAQLATAGAPRPAGTAESAHTVMDPSGRIWFTRQEYARAYPLHALNGPLGEPIVELRQNYEEEDHAVFSNVLFRMNGDMVMLTSGRLAIIPASELNQSQVIRPRWRALEAGGLGTSAFDANGNLWVPDVNGEVRRYSAADLDGTGPLRSQAFPIGEFLYALTIDAEGGVLVLATSGDLYRMPKGGSAFARLGSIGTGVAHDTVLTLNPPAEGTPLAAGFPKRLATAQP